MAGNSLRITAGPAAGQTIEFDVELVIGRTEGEPGSLGDDPELSRQHARIAHGSDGALQVEDLGSTNGTFVNDSRISQVQPLHAGDVIRVGMTSLEVEAAYQPTVARGVPAAAAAMQVTAGPATGHVIQLDAEELLIGRSADESGRLGNDEELSREHARIRASNGQFEIEDLGSTNGTFVNGSRLTGPHTLQPGDTIELGGSKLEVTGLDIDVGQTTRVRAQPPAAAETPAAAPPTPAAPRPNGIEVEGLIREFKDGPRAVDAIEFRVEPGEIYGFLGPNGAGKSTTVHMLTTLLAPSGGTARVAGYDIVKEGANVRATIGVALQEAALDPVLNSWEHMSLQTALQGVPKAERRARAEALIERVGLSEAADRKVGGYSGGMKRRLDLALALAHNPRVLFLDEPTTGLDPQSRQDLWEEVARLKKEEGVTVFLTTQYLEEADLLADRVGIIEKGHIVAEGTPAELKAEIGRPTVEAVPQNESDAGRLAGVLGRFGEPATAAKGVAVRLQRGVDDLADIVRALDAEGVRIANLQLHAPTLDDVFLAKTGRSLEDSAEETDRLQQAGRTQVSLPGQPIVRG